MKSETSVRKNTKTIFYEIHYLQEPSSFPSIDGKVREYETADLADAIQHLQNDVRWIVANRKRIGEWSIHTWHPVRFIYFAIADTETGQINVMTAYNRGWTDYEYWDEFSFDATTL